MTTQLNPIEAMASPFDSIRRTRADGSEYWSARDLQPLLGYDKWERFEDSIDRAQVAARNSGEGGFSRLREELPNGGRPRTDFHLSRFAAYLVAMNGDPRKLEVAAAQSYFAIRTREAETAPAPKELSRLELIELAREAELSRMAAEDRNVQLSGQVAQLEPKARTFDLFLGASGDYSVGEAAKILSRDHGINIGERRLFAFMEQSGWVYRVKGRPIPYQARVDSAHLVAKARWYTDDETGEQVAATPQVRVTAKGLDSLRGKLIAGATP